MTYSEVEERLWEKRMFTSVIVCTYNRSHLLKRTLQSLARQTVALNRYEVIVIDDASQDNTREVCHAAVSTLRNLRYIALQKNVGAAGARNKGIEAAKGTYLLFTDDDCIPAEDWIEKMISSLERVNIVAGAISSPRRNYFKLGHNIAQFHPFMTDRRVGNMNFATTANLGFHRTVLEQLNGFQQELRIAQDTELSLHAMKEGFRIYFSPDAVVIHDPDQTNLSGILRHSVQHASVTVHLRNQYRSLLRTPFILRSPILILIASPLIALKVTVEIYLSNKNVAKLFWTAPLVYLLKLAWCWGAARGLRKKRVEVK
jgi:GT2 family glycosyltransferase